MNDWMTRVASNAAFFPPFDDPKYSRVFAAYEMCAMSDGGGFVSYFMSDAADAFEVVEKLVAEIGLDDGWVREIRRVFNGSVPLTTESRDELLTSEPGWSEGRDPLEEAQRLFGNARGDFDIALSRFMT